jgi:hypothetical protein
MSYLKGRPDDYRELEQQNTNNTSHLVFGADVKKAYMFFKLADGE